MKLISAVIFLSALTVVKAQRERTVNVYDLQGTPVYDSCNNQLGVLTSGTERVTENHNCKQLDATTTQCTSKFHVVFSGAKILFADGTTGVYTDNFHNRVENTFDASTGSSTTKVHTVFHQGTITHGSALNDQFMVNQKCTYVFDGTDFTSSCDHPNLIFNKCTGSA